MTPVALRKVWHLGVKELWSLARDPVMLVLIVYTFTAGVYVAATAQPDTLSRATLAIVDEDASPLSQRIRAAFTPPQFMPRRCFPSTRSTPGSIGDAPPSCW